MSDLDDQSMPHNTPEAREVLVNAPAWADGMTFSTYPRKPPDEFSDVVCLHPRSAVLYGPPGSGKTGLAVGALRSLARLGVGSTFYWNMVTGPGNREAVASGEEQVRLSPCWFESWPRLLALHRRERWDEEGWFEQLEERVTVLVLDDVGVDAGTPYRESFLLRHVEWAAGHGRALILTLNDRSKDWGRVLGERVHSRIANVGGLREDSKSEKRFLLVPVLP